MTLPRTLLVLAALPAFAGAFVMAQPAAVASESTQRIAYVLFNAGSDGSSMSGSADDFSRARALRSGRESLLYFRDGRAAYVIRDPATLRRAEAIFEPQRRVGAQQGELGRRQGELGRRQAALGAQQARLGALQAGSSPKRQSELGRQQGELGRRQGELGRQQGELGRRQGILGAEQARLAREAEVQLQGLFADALRRGLAQRVN